MRKPPKFAPHIGLAFLGGVMLAGVPTGAVFAQDTGSGPTTPPKASGDKNATMTPTVTVTGKKSLNKIDRQVYEVGKDADSQTGTAADALNKVPGVAVDSSGNVTFRGKNVQILLNGHPSLLLSGDNRGIALQSMPSSFIQSIEVISNPGAQFGSGSGGAVINIVTRHDLPPGQFGSASLRATSSGGGMASVFDSYHEGKLSLTGVASYISDVTPTRYGSDLKQTDSSNDLLRESQGNGQSRARFDATFMTGTLQYDLTHNDTLAAGLGYQESNITSRGSGLNITYGPSGAPTDDDTSVNTTTSRQSNTTLTGDWTHYGKKPDETLTVHTSLSRGISNALTDVDTDYTLSSVATNIGAKITSIPKEDDARKADLSVDYKTPLGDDQVEVGGEYTRDDDLASNAFYGPDPVGASAPTLNTQLSSDFRYGQGLAALYATYQKELGDRWTVLGGLRSESLDLHTDELTSHTTGRINYTKLLPSAFATYVLSPKSKLRLSYSHRLVRPTPRDVNPYTFYVDANDVSAGNPNLKPEETDSFEAGYEYADKNLVWSLRGFHRNESDYIVLSSFYIPDPQNVGNQVLETTRTNAGAAQTTGLDLNYSNRFWQKLQINADVTWSHETVRNPSIPGLQSANPLSATLSATYTFKNKDQFAFRYKAVGEVLTGQGYSGRNGRGDLQYSHNLTPKLQLIAEIDDVFRDGKTLRVIDTPLVHNTSYFSRQAPTFFVALSRRFGGFSTSRRHN